jgi:Family of unknown function (DUF6493)
MMMDAGAIEAAITHGDVARVRSLLWGATEEERAACATALGELLVDPGARLGWTWSPATAPQREVPQAVAYIAAAVGVAGGAVAAFHALHVEHHFDWGMNQPRDSAYEAIAGVLADRKPQWLAAFVRECLRPRPEGGFGWTLVRRLVRLGVIDRPGDWTYTASMVASARSGSALALMHADPGLLEDEVWRLFTEPAAAVALDGVSGAEWAGALARLSARGMLDRDRLLDESLEAFFRDFQPRRLGWYVVMHDALAPSAADMAPRAERYLALLGAQAKAGVTLGQQACGRLLNVGLLDPSAFLAASGPALLFPQKSVATAHLRLIGTLAASRPAIRDAALVTAAQAFGHQREDVQAAALKLLGKHGPSADLAASLTSPTSKDTLVARVPVVEDGAGVVLLLGRLMEDATDAVAVEQALAGAVRFAGMPLAKRIRLAVPVLKRARQVAADDPFEPFSGYAVRTDVARLALAWGTGVLPPAPEEGRPRGDYLEDGTTPRGTIAGIMSARIRAACELIIEGRPGLLLAEPEYADGSIGHQTLLERVAQLAVARGVPALADLEAALLRLAPGAGEEFWADWAWAAGDADLAEQARRAYDEASGATEFGIVALGPSLPSVLARPHTPDGELRDGPQPGAASRSWRMLTHLPATGDEQFLRNLGWASGARLEEVVAAWPLLCPGQPELIAAHLLGPISSGLESGRPAARVALAGIALPGRPFGQVGHLAMVAGLASGDASTRIAAAEVWTRASADRRLDPDLAASAMAEGIRGHAFRRARLADGLEHAAKDSVATRNVAAAALATVDALLARPAVPAAEPAVPTVVPVAVSTPAARTPTGLHLLLEVAARAVAAPGAAVDLPASVAALAVGQTSTKLAQAARRLAALASAQHGNGS